MRIMLGKPGCCGIPPAADGLEPSLFKVLLLRDMFADYFHKDVV
jgi:hypothetical protein